VAGAPGDRSPHIDRFDPTCHAQTVLVGPTLGFQRLSRHLIFQGLRCSVSKDRGQTGPVRTRLGP